MMSSLLGASSMASFKALQVQWDKRVLWMLWCIGSIIFVSDRSQTILYVPDRSQKSRIRETSNISTDADSRTDTISKRLHDLSKKNKK